MAVWVCTSCGYEKEARCKPRKCPECGGDSIGKKDEPRAAAAAPAPRAAAKRAASKRGA